MVDLESMEYSKACRKISAKSSKFQEIPLSLVSKSSGIWVNGTKESLHDNYLKHDRSRLPPPSQVKLIIPSIASDEIEGDDKKVCKGKKKIISDDRRRSFPGSRAYGIDFDLDNDVIDLKDNLNQIFSPSSNEITKMSYRNNSRNWYLNPTHVESAQAYETLLEDELQRASVAAIEEKEKEHQRSQAFAQSAMISPYEDKLFQLRRQKLKLEEAYLLKLKCDEELEKTRLPKPKWYELKTKQFTKEMEKHNFIVRNQSNMEELLDYRNELFIKSKEYGEFSLADENG